MIRSVADLQIRGKTVFLRLDLNVPLDANKKISDDTRIIEALPTIEHCLNEGAKLVICSHLGRPDGKVNPEYSLEPVGNYLAEKLGREVILLEDYLGDGGHQVVKHGARSGELILLENIRFHPGEEANEEGFARELSHLAEVYVNDAFGACHRKHASIYGLPSHVADVAAGFLVQKELRFLDRLIVGTDHPFVLVTGGAKVTDKLKAIENLLNHVDQIIVGGAMAYAFLAAQGKKIGSSKCERQGIPAAKSILEKAEARGVKILLPEDHIGAEASSAPGFAKATTINTVEIPEGMVGLDIGPKTIARFERAIGGAKTIFWNGPMGLFENENYAFGTKAVGNAIAKSAAVKVAGGGDTLSAIHQFCDAAAFDLLSTGGGASLQYLEGRGLPGIDILNRKSMRRPNSGALNTESE